MEDKQIYCVMDFIQEVYKLYADPKLKPKKHLFFRGQPKHYSLLPSALRKPEYNKRDVFLDYKQVKSHKMNYLDDLENIIVEMQHYGMPTSLLDWTVMPLVALYFACSKNNDEDGEVHVLNPWNAYHDILEHNKMFHDSYLPSQYMDIMKTSRMLYSIGWEFKDIQSYISKHYDFNIIPEDIIEPIPFVGRYMNDRIEAQKGDFVIWGENKIPLEDNPFYKRHIEKVIVSKDSKEIILDELNKLYITPFFIFPDNKGIADMIKDRGSLFNLNRLAQKV